MTVGVAFEDWWETRLEEYRAVATAEPDEEQVRQKKQESFAAFLAGYQAGWEHSLDRFGGQEHG